MPLLTLEETATVQELLGRPVIIEGLPTFNLDDDNFLITDVEGWDNTGKPDSVLNANGGAAGSIASGAWLPGESYLVVSGSMFAPQNVQPALRSLLLQGLPAHREAELVVLGNGEPDKRMFVRRYDIPTITSAPHALQFSIPVVAADPYKYGLEPLRGNMGVFTGELWYRTYTLPGTRWIRTYVLDGSRWVRRYVQSEPAGQYPASVSLNSVGEVESYRVKATVTGPLEAGDWWLLNETAGRRLWADVNIGEGQTLEIDCARRSAKLNGAEATHLIYGDWLSLLPGLNTFRLVGGSASPAYASIEALPAFE